MRKAMVETAGSQLSVRRQCELLGLNRNRLDCPSRGGIGKGDLGLARRIDEIHLRFPEFGARRMSQWLLREGWEGANRRKVSQIDLTPRVGRFKTEVLRFVLLFGFFAAKVR